MDSGIKTKNRVNDYGEVFTPDSMVNSMLDLLDSADRVTLVNRNEYITKTFLEPACGDGQFLIRVLYRKLLHVQELAIEQRQLALIKSLSSIYGVDIMPDNIRDSRSRLFDIATGQQVSTFDLNNKTELIQIDLGIEITDQLKNVINFILEHNIIKGDTLNDTIEILCYHFNDTNGKVSIAKAELKNPEFEYDLSNEVNIMNMPNINTDDDDEYFDF